MKKITITGQWRWRKDELSVKEFRELSSTDREEYVVFLKGLKKEELGTNDEHILRQYPVEITNNKFFEL